MCRCARVYLLGTAALQALLRGEARLRNWPADAQVVAVSPHPDGKRIGLRVSSARFAPVPVGEPLPLVVACLEYVAQPVAA